MKNLLYFFILFASGSILAQCPGPAQRNALLNLQRAIEVEGTRAGQIPLSDTCGNQRYAQYVEVNPDTISYIPADSGNTENLSEFVRDTLGQLWYIDWQGNAVQFQGGGGSCDVDFLQISDNSCPDALTDSIYKYKYVAIGARYVFPGAELLVNDSTSSAIAVIQGFRNSRLALWDSNSGKFVMIDQAGGAPVFYLPVDADLTFKTTVGTPKTPIGPQVNHFGINTSDSTIQMHQYPNTRRDTAAVLNFLYTDATGKIRSQSPDSIPGFSANIYNTSGNISPPDILRAVNLDTLTTLQFNYPSSAFNDTHAILIYAGDDSTGVSGGVTLGAPRQGNSYLGVSDAGTEIVIPGIGKFWVHTEDGPSLNNLQLDYAAFDAILQGELNTSSEFYADTTSVILMQSVDPNIYPNGNIIGFDPTIGAGLHLKLNGDEAQQGQILKASADGTFHFADSTSVGYNIGNSDLVIPDGINRNLKIDSTSSLNILYANDIPALYIFAGDDTNGALGVTQINSPSAANNIRVQDETGIDVLFGGLDIPNSFYLHNADESAFFQLTDQEAQIESNDAGGTENHYRINADAADGQVSWGVNDQTTDRSANIGIFQNDVLAGVSARFTLSAFDATASNFTLVEIDGDTNGVKINTRGTIGSSGDFLQNSGGYGVWDGGGTFNADMLSYSPGSGGNVWTAVTANRVNALIGPGTLTPGESTTEIVIDTAAVLSTVNLNYTPDSRYDGNFTTVRYIYNLGSGACTVQTNQSWMFKTITGSAATLTILSGESYKLVWLQNATASLSRFYAVKLQ